MTTGKTANFSASVLTTGQVACWGADSSGKSTPPPDTFLSVSAGTSHTCGITTLGEVKCWGDDAHGQSTPLPFIDNDGDGVMADVDCDDNDSANTSICIKEEDTDTSSWCGGTGSCSETDLWSGETDETDATSNGTGIEGFDTGVSLPDSALDSRDTW